MATTPKNTKYRVAQDVLDFQIDPTGTFNEGDLMYWDAASYIAKPLDSISAASYMLGISQGTNPVTHTNSQGFSKSVSIYVGPVTAKLVCKETGAYYFGTPAYYSTDAQGFTTVSGSGAVPIGVMQGSAKERGVGSGTTVVGQEYEILLRKSYAFNY